MDSKGSGMISMHALRRFLAVALLAISGSTALAAGRFDPPVDGLPDYATRFDAAREPEADLQRALAAATQKNQRVLLMVGGDWCVWCFLLDRHFDRDREAAKRFYGGFEVMRVYYNDDNRNQAFLSKFPDFTLFPHFFVVEPDGRVAGSVVADVMIRDARYDNALIDRFIQSWQPAPPR